MRTIVIIFLVVAIGLFLAQRKLMYFPRKYAPGYVKSLVAKGLIPIRFTTSSGTQWAYYRPPGMPVAAGDLPESIWVLFGGNGSLALDWLMFLPPDSEPQAGLLLVDYPGYGECEGRTTRAAIDESLAALVPALAAELQVPKATIGGRLSVGGHSLGAAVALEFAQMHPVRDIVLISAFTSMKDMAKQTVGWPLCEVLIDRYDNRATLAALAGRNPRPTLRIFHGADDNLILPRMGRELAALHPGWASYHEFIGADHMDVVGESIIQCDRLRR